MKIAVIGANSFCGSAFANYLWAKHGIECGRFVSKNFDLRTQGKELADFLLLRQYTHVINFAALNVVQASWNNADNYYLVNVVGLARLVDRLIEREWKGKFVQMTTPEVYGSHAAAIQEGCAFNPSTPYAVSRAAGDQHLLLQHKAHGFDVSLVRTCNVYGPAQQRYRIIPHAILSLLNGEKIRLEGDGASKRAFIHILDAVEAWSRIMLHGASGHTYHVTNGDAISISNLVTMICALMGRDFASSVDYVKDRTNKDHAYILVGSELFGWTPAIPLEAGLQNTIAWYTTRSGS